MLVENRKLLGLQTFSSEKDNITEQSIKLEWMRKGVTSIHILHEVSQSRR